MATVKLGLHSNSSQRESSRTSMCRSKNSQRMLQKPLLPQQQISILTISSVQKLQSLLVASPVDTSAYLATKTSLLAIQTSGVAVRMNNQKIAPSGNAAINGINSFANAQQTEIAQAMALTGNVADDSALLNTLVTEVNAGTAANAKNRVLALGGQVIM